MRIATVAYGGGERLAVVEGEHLVLLPAGLGDLVDVVQGGPDALARLRAAAEASREKLPLGAARLLPPIRRFGRDVLCTGWNYWEHFDESFGRREGQDVPKPDHPTFFTKRPDVVIGPHDPIAFDPALSTQWDYEAELAVVIGKTGRNIPVETAMDHVFGYCLANDVSLRNVQRAHGGQWLKGKSVDATMPIGPWVVTADALDYRDVTLQCVVNGVTLQDGSTRLMAFDLPTLIAEASRGMTLHAGELFLTGTPSGIGNARTPQIFLKAGDEVIVRGTGLGELRNRMTLTDLHGPAGGGSNHVPAEAVAP
ncbi:fumarylacetoacetate hydrolase family protein [Rhodoplanes roseus]|uniref:5-carboxymethyl-2-hydroxymuconate isomerase n=1 Tax=Rhodoplanes roseus TaxID=29409 RepID=A0A327KZR0_9BRAD|nr:fumarylacetoacetate hydrolase family protein [Rhodoplanes roseus]RAI43554.1 5-carboxymethyl-2-hydroxymuconate isomerase [Rhodoplanes roseus]